MVFDTSNLIEFMPYFSVLGCIKIMSTIWSRFFCTPPSFRVVESSCLQCGAVFLGQSRYLLYVGDIHQIMHVRPGGHRHSTGFHWTSWKCCTTKRWPFMINTGQSHTQTPHSVFWKQNNRLHVRKNNLLGLFQWTHISLH